MSDEPHHAQPRIDRRTTLKGLLGAGAVLGGVASPALADDDGGPLAYTPVYFSVYLGRGHDPADFSYPDGPVLGGFDDKTDNGPIDGPGKLLFDSSEIVRDDDELHHVLKFRQDEDIVGSPVPYTLKADDDELYTASGDIVDFQLPEAGDSGQGIFPLQFLRAPAPYRAVFRNGIKLYGDGEKEGEFEWAYTRVDFYSQGSEKYVISALYIIWDDELGGNPPTNLLNVGRSVIQRGKLSYDGKPGRGRGRDDEDEDDEEENEESEDDENEEEDEEDEEESEDDENEEEDEEDEEESEDEGRGKKEGQEERKARRLMMIPLVS